MKRFSLKIEKMFWLMLLMSLLLYGVDYLIFGRSDEIGRNFLGNLGFLPIYVLFVTLIIERVVKNREQIVLKQKLNMVIGAFFSEVGTALMRDHFGFVQNSREFGAQLQITAQWKAPDFRKASDFVNQCEIRTDSRMGELGALKQFLIEKRQFMLGLLENSNLLEHDEFTDLLWAVFHLTEELEARRVLERLPASDMDHLSQDIRRAYAYLLREWIAYMSHLHLDYPYLFSLAVRANPMNPKARVEVE